MAPEKSASQRVRIHLPPEYMRYVDGKLKQPHETNAEFFDRAIRAAFPEHAHHLPRPNPQGRTAIPPLEMQPPTANDLARIQAFFVAHVADRRIAKTTATAVFVLERVTDATAPEVQHTMEAWGHNVEASKKALDRAVKAGVAERFRDDEDGPFRYRLVTAARNALKADETL